MRAAILALAAVLAMACFSGEVSDSDTFWHLETGRYIAQNHRLPVPDPFSWATYVGKEAYAGEAQTRYFNLTHEWLTQLFFYSLYAAGGYGGMVLARALIAAMICAGVFAIGRRRTGDFYGGLAAAGLFVAVQYATPFLDRPLLLTVLLLTAALVVLEYGRWLWSLPVLFLLWGNLHGGYIVGWAALGAYCTEDLWRRRKPGTLLYWSAAAVLATGINPNGFRAVQVLLFYQQSAMQSQIMEWTPPALWPPIEMFTIVLYAAGLLLLWKRGKARPADWMLYGFFALAAARASRNIVFVAMVGAVVIVTYFPWRRAMPAIGEWVVACGLGLGIAAQVTYGHAFELRAATWRYPEGPAAFLEKHHVSGRMLNTHSSGGYLMWRLWPLQKTMIDGRALNEVAFHDAMRMINSQVASDGGGKSYDQLLDDYGIEVIVMEGFEYYSGRPWWLAVNLATLRQDTWKLVYRDATGVVFMRRPPEGVTPVFGPEAVWSFEAACTAHLEKDPAWPGCASGLARVFAGLKDVGRVRKWAGEFLARQKNPSAEDLAALRGLQ